MRNFLVLFIIALLSVGALNAIEISEFQSKVKKIETQDEQIKYLESIKKEILSTNNTKTITQYSTLSQYMLLNKYQQNPM